MYTNVNMATMATTEVARAVSAGDSTDKLGTSGVGAGVGLVSTSAETPAKSGCMYQLLTFALFI